MLARRLDPPEPRPPRRRPPGESRAAQPHRTRGLEPTRGPAGPVRWWERPAPRGDELLWEAVRRLQARRIALGRTVLSVARDLVSIGHPLRRETLSRVLNGSQRTSWPTADALAEVLGVDLDDLHARRRDAPQRRSTPRRPPAPPTPRRAPPSAPSDRAA